jgi:hypothetical protein
MKRPATVAALVALLAVLGGVAYATIPDSGGVIHGCYKNENGQLRVIDSATDSCLSSETAIDWSQTGPSGPTGPSGASGPSGPSGPEGTALGWAHVQADGSILSSKGVVQVTHPATGVYCFDLSFTPNVVVATVTGFAGLGNQLIHTSEAVGADDACLSPNPSDAAAYTLLPSGVREDVQFFIEFN